MKLHHINIKAPKELLQQERDFFCAVLGLREGNRPDFSSRGYWLYAGDKAIVHLSESDAHFRNEKQGFFDHVAFQTTNLKQLIQNLEDRKVEYSTAYLPEIEMTQVFLKAPSNTGIEINFENEKI
jgi:catechol 2,3-dioxygenase-like lactoylglutathione lyase family enzyme